MDNQERGLGGSQNRVSPQERMTSNHRVARSSTALALPGVLQCRVPLSDFGVNQWELTPRHYQQLNHFRQQLLNSVDYTILSIEGRASNTGPESVTNTRRQSGPGNRELSRLRANTVAQWLYEEGLLSNHNPNVVGYGSSSPLIPADGELGINRSVVISYTIVKEFPPSPPSPIQSTNWEITLTTSASGGEVAGILWAKGKLKSSLSVTEYDIEILNSGMTASLLPAGISHSRPSFSPFTTHRPVDTLAFHRVRCRVSSVTLAGGIGASLTFINMPSIATTEIPLYGFTAGYDGSLFGGLVGHLTLETTSLRAARAERRRYNAEVRAFHERYRQYREQQENSIDI